MIYIMMFDLHNILILLNNSLKPTALCICDIDFKISSSYIDIGALHIFSHFILHHSSYSTL